MPIFSVSIKNNQIIFVSTIGMPPTSSLPTPDSRPYRTLFDTGAQLTGISPNVVSELGLTAVCELSIMGVSGTEVKTGGYRVRLNIPILTGVVLAGGKVVQKTDLRGRTLDVAKLPYQPPNYDVILGMDFIGSCHVTIQGGAFVLSI